VAPWYADPIRLQLVGLIVQSVSALVTSAGVLLALFQDRIRERLKDRPKLMISFENDSNHSHGWIRRISAPASDKTKVHFFRARITNNGRCPAESVVLTLAKVEFLDSPSSSREPVMALRWSNTWKFLLDESQTCVAGSSGGALTTLESLPSGIPKHCDVCFFVDPQDPQAIGKSLFEKDKVYFAVDNLPSASLALPSGSYRLHLYLSAFNAAPSKILVEMEINLAKSEPTKMVQLRSPDR